MVGIVVLNEWGKIKRTGLQGRMGDVRSSKAKVTLEASSQEPWLLFLPRVGWAPREDGMLVKGWWSSSFLRLSAPLIAVYFSPVSILGHSTSCIHSLEPGLLQQWIKINTTLVNNSHLCKTVSDPPPNPQTKAWLLLQDDYSRVNQKRPSPSSVITFWSWAGDGKCAKALCRNHQL